MISKPLARINKFTEMSDSGGIYYLDGFSVENEQGSTTIDDNYFAFEYFNIDTTNYSNFLGVDALAYVYPLLGSNITASTGYTVTLDGATMYSYSLIPTEMYQGHIGGSSSSGQYYLACQKPDIFVLPSGDLIYTANRYLTKVVRGLCHSDSTTTTIVDKDGRNFVTLGFATNDKITNLITGSIYTVTAIGNENATNDKLTFDAIGATTNAENDEFMFVKLQFRDFNYVNGVDGTTVTVPTFNGQPSQVYWSRPIRQYGDQYLILSGNYIALLANDESTLDSTYKQLPIGYQGIAMDINGYKILVSAYDSNGGAHLLSWDGSVDGWNEDINISRAPYCVKSYRSGFVYLADGIVYYTDGMNIQKLNGFPDTITLSSYSANSPSHNSIAIINDDMYFGINNNNNRRGINGILVFNQNTGFTQFKCKSRTADFAAIKCVYVKPNASLDIYSSNNGIDVGCDFSFNYIREFRSATLGHDYKSFVYLIDFGQETQVKEVWLNIKHSNKVTYGLRKQSSIVSVNYGNDEYPIINYGSVSSNTTTTISNGNGVNYPGIVGKEVELIDGVLAGERTFIQSIADAGTANEVWTVSPPLSAINAGSSTVKIWGVKNGETKTVDINDLNKPVRFNVNFLGSKMYLEVTVRGNTDSFPISIHDILLF